MWLININILHPYALVYKCIEYQREADGMYYWKRCDAYEVVNGGHKQGIFITLQSM